MDFLKTLIYLCMQSTQLNMFLTDWGETHLILIKMVFLLRAPPTQKVEECFCKSNVVLKRSQEKKDIKVDTMSVL